MYQNYNNNNIKHLRGSVYLSDNNIPIFRAGSRPKTKVMLLTNNISFISYNRFCRFLKLNDLFDDNNVLKCNFNTLKALFAEFEEMAHNESFTNLLAQHNIYPPTPDFEYLNKSSNSLIFIWLMKTRRLLRSAMGAGFS